MTILDNGKPDHRTPRFQKQTDDPAGFTTLTAQEREKIREQARLTVLKELQEREEKSLLDIFLKEERQKLIPEEQLMPIWLNLAMHQPHIRLDDKLYLNEVMYDVTASVFAVLAEQMARGWAHEEETEVRDARTRRRAQPPPLSIVNYGNNRQPRGLKTASWGVDSALAEQRAVVVPR